MEDRDKIIDYTKPIRVPDDCSKVRKNFTQGYFYREIGRYKNVIPSEFQWAAEDKLINKNTFEELKCQLPDSPRSTFLMVFSPDGKKVASTHGNHNVYVTDLTTGKNIQTLSGHPRTPWCIAFHPSSNQILASGCLGGQVRVWDLHGGSEVWTAESQTVIASLAFHPVDRMLVIATYNELHFWDWSQPEPFAKCSTKTEREKVRYVSFDRLGNKLITGIANPVNVPSQWDRINVVNSQSPSNSTTATTSFTSTPSTTVASTQASTDQGRSITFCYRHLMNQYNQLVNRYFDLSRSRITPTIDRGTDPMDLLDLRNNGSTSTSENTLSNPSPSTSNSQTSASSPLRFKITRSASRTYRPLSSRERFRIHSSIFSRLNNRSSLPSNPLAFSTTPSTLSSQNSTFTAPLSLSSPSTSSSQSIPRLRRYSFSLGPTARSLCLTLTPESSSNLFFTRNTSQTTSSSRAVTNPTYTSYSDRGIFSTRETSSNNSGSQLSLFWPYRVLFDDADDHRLTIHRTAQPENSENSSNRSSSETGTNALNNESLIPVSRCNSTSIVSARSHHDTVLHSSDETERESQRPSSGFHFRRQRNDLTSLSRPTAEESTSHNEFPHPTRSSTAFQLTPVDLRNVNEGERGRDGDSFERRFSAESLMHPRPVARFQVRSRLLQEHQSQLHLITNRETHGLNLQSNQNLRRQLSFRPEGQFVLSRHSNSPFQPRVPHQINNSPRNNSPTLSKNTSGNKPEIPSLKSSFTSSLSSNLNSTEAASSTSSEGNNNFSPSSIASNLSFMGESSSRQLREQIKTRLFDRVEVLLRDCMRNSSEVPSIDSTVNYSQISGESEADVNSLESEDINLSRGLGPRGTDPMLSSTSENRDISNEDLFLHESSSTHSQNSNNASVSGNGFGGSQNESEILNLWESDGDTVPLSLNSNSPLNDLFNEQSQHSRDPAANRNSSRQCQNTETRTTSRESTNSNSSSAEFSMRQGIQRLSLHIENMQRLCWARIEILQRQKIRGMWENLTNQIRQFQNIIQARTERDNSTFSNQNDNSSSGSGLPSFRDLAISSSSSAETNSPSPSTSSNYNIVLNGCKELVESMVNELFNGTKNLKDSRQGDSSVSNSNSQSSDKNPQKNNSKASETAGTAATSSKNEEEEPQPGPSGLTVPNTSRGVKNYHLKNENLTFRLYKHFIETLQRERRRRGTRPGGMNASCGLPRQNQFRLRNSSRARFRNYRHGRHILDFFASRSRTINRELEALLKSRRKERTSSRTHQSSISTANQQPSTSTAKNPGSSDACQSCGQKKKPIRECIRQKRRSTDSLSESGAIGSTSKVLKNNTGERSKVPGEESRDEGSEPSTSTQESTSSQGQDNSTNELLRQMIQTMETMLRFLREAFFKTEELAGSQTLRQQSTVLSSSDSDDSDSNDLNDSTEQFLRNLPRNFRCTKEIITNLMRDFTQLHAKKLSRFMIKSLTQFFGKNFRSLIQVLDEQIFSLYMLLHLALELTDLLLDQLDARSRDLERTWAVGGSSAVNNTESRARNFFLSRSSDASGRRPRYRNIARNSYTQSFSSSAEDHLRRKLSINPLLPSNSRSGTSRLNTLGSSTGTNHDGCGTYLSNYVTNKMRTARMSNSLPSGWCRRGSRTLVQSSSPLNSNSTRNLRSFRFDRRTNEENESHSGVRAFDYEGTNDNNSNHNIQASTIIMNNSNNNINSNDNNSNDNNNSGDLSNNTSNNYNSNDSRSSSSSSNNNTGYYDANVITSNNANRNSGPINNNDNNTNNNYNSNFFNPYFPSSSSSNSDSSNNNIIIVTGLNSENDVINSSGNNINNSRSMNSEGNSSRPSGSNSFLSQNPLTPLRSMELTLSRNESGDLSLRDERPIFWIRYGGNSETSSSSNNNDSQSRISTFTVPLVQVNDVPVSDVSLLNQPRHRPQSPVPRVPEDVWRWRAWRPRLLHPRYSGPNPFEDQDSNDVPENIHYYRILSTSDGSHLGVYTLDPMIIADAPLSPRHRIQAWDFSKMNIPDISDREANGVVPECKIHNDASVDVSNDGHLLVTLLPCGRFSVTTMLGVYSLDWSSLGQLLYRTSFEQNAVSVSLSPTNRHLLVGLASRPIVVRDRTNMAQIFRLEGGRPSPNGGSWQSGRGRLVHMRDLEQTRETNIMSLNCIRWAPGAGQGLVYGTNTGQLKVLR